MLSAFLSQQLGASDCEAIRDGLVKQPINSATSLAFSAVGIVIALAAFQVDGDERRVRLVFGSLMIATGIGSALFHGPQTAGSHFLHDVTFLVTLWVLAVVNVAPAGGWDRRAEWVVVTAGAISLAVVLIAFPDITNWLTAALVAVNVLADVIIHLHRRRPRRWYALAGVSLSIAVALLILGRTGSAWCDPESLIQGHGGWHVFVAITLGAYFMGTSAARIGGGKARA